MQKYRLIIAINILALLILCVFAAGFAFHGGAGRATAGNVAAEVATAKDPTAQATTGSAVAAATIDGVIVTSIAGTPDVILNFGDETVIAAPLFRDFSPEDYGHNLVKVHRGADLDGGELYDGTTRQLWAMSITTQAV
jgi:hypothetical protein